MLRFRILREVPTLFVPVLGMMYSMGVTEKSESDVKQIAIPIAVSCYHVSDNCQFLHSVVVRISYE